MALDQSINEHAINCLKGDMAYADINSAVNKWHVNNAMRSEIANALLEHVNMKSNEGDNKEVKEQRKKGDKEDLEKLKKLIPSMINSFLQRKLKDYLFNLKTGKQITKVAETYLLDVMKNRDREIHLSLNVKKTLIDLRNPFARLWSTSSHQSTLLRKISQSKPKN